MVREFWTFVGSLAWNLYTLRHRVVGRYVGKFGPCKMACECWEDDVINDELDGPVKVQAWFQRVFYYTFNTFWPPGWPTNCSDFVTFSVQFNDCSHNKGSWVQWRKKPWHLYDEVLGPSSVTQKCLIKCTRWNRNFAEQDLPTSISDIHGSRCRC